MSDIYVVFVIKPMLFLL